MAPTYNRNQNRRQNRIGYVDHDIYEGLPVRHWRRDYVTVAPPSAQDNTSSQNDIWSVELPHGMPKDSHLLPQHSQDLLRAARSGRVFKRPAPVEEEEADVEVMLGEKTDKKDEDPKDKGFMAKAWKQIPRHLEGPDIEYLAKRRKGLITVSAKPVPSGPTLTKATVKKIDAAGNEYLQNVVVPQGQQIEGEVVSQTTITGPAVEEYVAHAPTPPQKRKGVPKGKKKKGLGRGKKKIIAPTSVPQDLQVEGVAVTTDDTSDAAGGPQIKIESEGSLTPVPNEDTEMADGSVHDSDEEEGEDGEEGDDEDEGSVDNPNSPSKPPRSLSTPPGSFPSIPIPSSEISEIEAHVPVPPGLLHVEHKLELKAGSPLKNVALANSALNSPLESPQASEILLSNLHAPQDATHISDPTALDKVMQEQVAETAPPTLPPPPPEPTVAEEIAAVELRQEEEEEEEMLLDIIENAENAENATVGVVEVTRIAEPDVVAPLDPVVETTESEAELESKAVEASSEKEDVQMDEIPAEPPQPENDDDGFPDLLGGLEKQLNEPTALVVGEEQEPEQAASPATKPEPEETSTVEEKAASPKTEPMPEETAVEEK